MSGKFWDDEARVGRLRQLWRDGMSASEICKELGAPSRSAVIGKLYRLGESRRNGFPGSDSVRLARLNKRREGPPKLKAERVRPAAPVLITAQNRPLLALGSRHCRWPITDVPEGCGDQMLFCGGKRTHDSSYCAFHASLSRMPVQPKLKDLERIFERFG